MLGLRELHPLRGVTAWILKPFHFQDVQMLIQYQPHHSQMFGGSCGKFLSIQQQLGLTSRGPAIIIITTITTITTITLIAIIIITTIHQPVS